MYMLTVFTLKGRVLSHLWWFCDVLSRPTGRSTPSIHLSLLANLLVVRFAFNRRFKHSWTSNRLSGRDCVDGAS